MPTAAHASNTQIVVPFTGTFNGDAFGDYSLGDTFTGSLSYDRVYNASTAGYFSGMSSVTINSSAYDINFLLGDSNRGEFNFVTGRSLPIINIGVSIANSNPHYLPTLSQFLAGVGSFSILGFGYNEATDELYSSGGSGSLKFGYVAPPMAAPVPEPATWASMFAGLALAGGVANYRRRKTKVAYA